MRRKDEPKRITIYHGKTHFELGYDAWSRINGSDYTVTNQDENIAVETLRRLAIEKCGFNVIIKFIKVD